MALPSPAYLGSLSLGGSPTAVTAEACSNVSGKTYRVTASAKRVLSPSVARTWKDNGVTVSAVDIESEDLLAGTVTFASGYTPTGPITVDATYIPRVALAWVSKADVSLKCDSVDVTDLNQSEGVRKRVQTLKDGSGSMEVTRSLDEAVYGSVGVADLLLGRAPTFVELQVVSGLVVRFWAFLDSADVGLEPGDVVRASIPFSLASQSVGSALAGISFGAL